ncbi:MAG: glycosyltransferase family 2 protein [Fimbriimonadaceae bacterium]|nr:glycosyltransferase family 2 protein [Fimbriimonadaceae bacterium]
MPDGGRRLGLGHAARQVWRTARYAWWPGGLAACVAPRRVRAERIAVCIGVLNRGGLRLEGLLRSLRQQTLPPECIDLTVCDLGSGPEPLADIRERCRRHQARLVALHEPEPLWCRARAVNAAVRCSAPAARYVFPTDVDMVFAPHFLETVIATHLAVRDRGIVISDALDLPPEAVIGEEDHWPEEFARLERMGRPRWCLGSGACQSTTRAWWERCHGYDERLLLWGYEDDDLLRRARRDGLQPISIRHRAAMLHQWHETVREQMIRAGRELEFERQYEANIALSKATDAVVRNPAGWGELPPTAEIVEPTGGG